MLINFSIKETIKWKKIDNKKIEAYWIISYTFICSDLPIRPPPSNDQVPCSWWNPNCCDRSLLVGTYKHGCESYMQIRADPTLCFMSHCGPGSGADETTIKE